MPPEAKNTGMPSPPLQNTSDGFCGLASANLPPVTDRRKLREGPLRRGLKDAFADIRSRHTERTAASPCGPIQTPKNRPLSVPV